MSQGPTSDPAKPRRAGRPSAAARRKAEAAVEAAEQAAANPSVVPDARKARRSGRPTSAQGRPRGDEAAAAGESPPPGDGPAFGEDQRQMIETLSLNLAKAAMTAQAAIAEAALTQADRPAALSPDPFNIAPAMTSVMSSLVARPEKLFQAQADLFGRYMDLWSSTSRRMLGEDAPPAPADKRFRDPAWDENPMFDVMRRSYLATSEWMNSLVANVEDVDPRT